MSSGRYDIGYRLRKIVWFTFLYAMQKPAREQGRYQQVMVNKAFDVGTALSISPFLTVGLAHRRKVAQKKTAMPIGDRGRLHLREVQ